MYIYNGNINILFNGNVKNSFLLAKNFAFGSQGIKVFFTLVIFDIDKTPLKYTYIHWR